MEIVNQSGLVSGWTMGFQPDGRELLVVVVKGTFTIPKASEEAALAEKQQDLTKGDEFTGDAGLSAVLYETDYSHRKPYCDVLLNGNAYSPRPSSGKVKVSLQVGSMRKSFEVVGNRTWTNMLGIKPCRPEPFEVMPLTYDHAFGGTDTGSENPTEIQTYLDNPVGIGYYPLARGRDLIGRALPNTEEIGQPIQSPLGPYKPMSFGVIGRNFASRLARAGTYDATWKANQAPLWPIDFDCTYFQSAPEAQWVPYLKGGEEVLLENLSSEPIVRFLIPRKSVPVVFVPHRGIDEQIDAVCDTLLIEPDQNRFMLTWRATLPLRRSFFDIKEVAIGEMPHSWRAKRRAAQNGKMYYRNLGELVSRKNI
jgi:hypothetical protein